MQMDGERVDGRRTLTDADIRTVGKIKDAREDGRLVDTRGVLSQGRPRYSLV
jgi:hypothetical protein